jgi:hypothetical protein
VVRATGGGPAQRSRLPRGDVGRRRALGEAAGAKEGAEGLEAARRVVATEPRILGPADSGTPKFLKDEMFSGQAPSFL